MVTTFHYLLLGAALFTIGVIGVLTRRNIMIILMSIELMMNAVNINLIAFAAGDRSGLRDFRDYRGCGGSRGWSRDRNRDVQEQRDDEHQRDRSDEVVSE